MGAVAVALVGAGAAPAQIPNLPGSTSTTTAPPTTTTAAPEPEPAPTTTAPPTDPAPTDRAAPGTDAPSPADPEPPGTDAPVAGTDPGAPPPPGEPPASPPVVLPPEDPAAPAPGEVPADAQATINAVRRSPANSTKRLMAALAPLLELGLSEQEAIAAGFGRFPVGGHATFSHDWLFPRFTPTFHLHQGTDIFAATGTPVRSPAEGTLKLSQGGSGGLAAYVYQPDGTYFYMAHLSAFVAGQKSGQKVKLGQTVGYVGDSGNAVGGSPHVHFEVHPAPTRVVTSGKGKNRTVTHVPRPVPVGSVLPAADPKGTLDQWLREALAAAPQLLASVESRPRALVATSVTRRFGSGRSGGVPAPVAPPRTHLLWASSVSPSGGALRLAEAEAMLAAGDFDWSQAARRQQELLEEQAAAVAWTAAVLAPITPRAMLLPESADE